MEPKIRFKGFDGEWKALPITEIASLKAGKSFNKLDAVDIPTVGYYPCYGGNGQRGYLPYYNQNGKYNIIGRQGALCGCINVAEGKFYATEHAVIVTPITVTDFEFLHESLVRANINQYATGAAQPGISVTNVNSQLSLNYPLYEEQKAIGKYFTSLDSQISASTSRLASLKQMKAASLQAMFPQEGETVPKVRFKGFEGKWKKVKFGTLLKECIDKSTSEDEDILLSSAINGVFLNSELFGHQRGRSNIGYRKIRKNMLILSAQNLHLGNANVNLRFEHGLVSPAYKIYDLYNVIPEFMYHWIKREETKKFFLDATTAGASLCRKNIVWTDLYKQKILLPESYAEQQAIANYFASLDHQITLQTQRLEKLKQMKAACLDKMFV